MNNTNTAARKIVIERNSYHTSFATGRTYWVDGKGLATEVTAQDAADYQDEQDNDYGCECEQDWNCGRHGGTTRPTWLESRYDNCMEDDR
jgi:hypothetical protein